MRVSELIKLLQEFQNNNGDLEVHIDTCDDLGEWPVAEIEFVPAYEDKYNLIPAYCRIIN